jgi:hypothetical protein
MVNGKKDMDALKGYDSFKTFDGRQYTGMKVGRTHNWEYDRARWKEKKITPDKWEFAYTTTKRRKGHAPEGSGVPVGTGYHWFILAHQFVGKLNADDYTTQMAGLKFKLAHKRADKEQWNRSANAQKKHLVEILRSLADEIEKSPEQVVPIPLAFEHKGQSFEGMGIPILTLCENGLCQEVDITLNGQHQGIIRHTEKGWKMTEIKSAPLVRAIGSKIEEWYQKTG